MREALKGWGRRLARPQRQAGALTADVLAVIRLTAPKPRARGLGLETAEQAAPPEKSDLALETTLSDVLGIYHKVRWIAPTQYTWRT